jgi:DNA polymerase-3 subunit delta
MIVIEDSFLSADLDEISKYFSENKESCRENTVIFWDKKIKTKKGKSEKIVMIDSSGREVVLTKKREKWFEYLKKQDYFQEFTSFSNLEVSRWVKEKFREQELVINNDALQLLISITGNNLWQLDKEINKLINYKKGMALNDSPGKEISLSEVKDLVHGFFDEDIFSLTDAISNQNKNIAIKLLEKQFNSGVNEYYLLNMMVRQIKIMLQIKQSLELGESSKKMISSLKLHPFIIQKGISQARRFSLESLKRSLSDLAEIDFCLKTGKGEAKTMLDLFVLRV